MHSFEIDNTVRVLSFDIWKTLLRGNRAFTRPRLQLIFDMLNLDVADMDVVVAAYRSSDRKYNDLMEATGKDFGFLPRLSSMFHELGIAPDRLPSSGDVIRIQRAIGAVRCQQEFRPSFIEPDLVDTLVKLRAKGYTLALLSNTGMDDHFVMEPVLQQLGLRGLFTEVLFTSAIGYAKPNRRVFLTLASTLSVLPAEVLHIGDNVNADYRGATQAGMHAVVYAPDGASDYPAISSMKELL